MTERQLQSMLAVLDSEEEVIPVIRKANRHKIQVKENRKHRGKKATDVGDKRYLEEYHVPSANRF